MLQQFHASGLASLLVSRDDINQGDARELDAELIDRAKQTFRAVRLVEEVLEMSFEDTLQAATAAALHSRAVAAFQGHVDAYLCHAWKDDAPVGHRLVSEWCEAFEEVHGHPPTVWLDKCCIPQCDQEHAAEAVQCLPLYLVGCQSLVLVHSPSLPLRLWCIMELFIFIHMAPQPPEGQHNVEILIPHFMTIDECIAEWSQFDVRKASCSMPKDEAVLMAIIEAAFLGYDTFNCIISRAVIDTLSRLNAHHTIKVPVCDGSE